MDARNLRACVMLGALALASAAGLPALPAAASAGGGEILPFRLSARSAILIDQSTGRALYEQNADMPIAPASLTKLMTLHIVYEKLEDRTIRRDDVVSISANAWAANQAPGSSLMFLEPGMIVTVEDLMKGMAIASGNDAATALAEYVAGSTRTFVDEMNDECRWMGYKTMRFTDPAGADEGNEVTAREFADFSRRFIDMHPQSLGELLSLREFDYPLARNFPAGVPRARKIRTVKQFNRNFLVWDGVDGLKTGHLDSENFTAAITARRGDTRLIAVVLGVSGATPREGFRKRADDGMALLSWGFRTFRTIPVEPPRLKPVRVWKGADSEVELAPGRPLAVTVRKGDTDRLAYAVERPAWVSAPVRKGQKIADLVFSTDGEEVGRFDLYATRDVEQAGILRRVADSVLMNANRLLGTPG